MVIQTKEAIKTWQDDPNGVRMTSDGQRYIVGDSPSEKPQQGRRVEQRQRPPRRNRVGQGF